MFICFFFIVALAELLTVVDLWAATSETVMLRALFVLDSCPGNVNFAGIARVLKSSVSVGLRAAPVNIGESTTNNNFLGYYYYCTVSRV